MKTCLIGGSGFIGKHLITELMASGRKVINIGRNDFDHPDVLHVRVPNLFDERLPDILTDGVDEVIYLAYATKPKTSFDNPVRDIEENLAQAVHLFETVARIPTIKKLVYVSSGGTVYGHTEDDLIPETHSLRPISPYGITKLTIEQYAHMFFSIYGLPVIVVRPSNAYGIGQQPREGQGFVAYAMQSILQNKPITIFGQSGTIRDYIYVSDIARAILCCLDKAAPGTTYNIGSQTGHSNAEIVSLLRGAIDGSRHQVTVRYSPARPFDVNKNILDTTALRTATGWSPLISLEEGLKITWDWVSQPVGQNKIS